MSHSPRSQPRDCQFPCTSNVSNAYLSLDAYSVSQKSVQAWQLRLPPLPVTALKGDKGTAHRNMGHDPKKTTLARCLFHKYTTSSPGLSLGAPRSSVASRAGLEPGVPRGKALAKDLRNGHLVMMLVYPHRLPMPVRSPYYVPSVGSDYSSVPRFCPLFFDPAKPAS